jgi:hypothetical protein
MRMKGRMDRQTDRQKDMPKLVVAFRNFAYAPEKCAFSHTVFMYFAFISVPTVTFALHNIN